MTNELNPFDDAEQKASDATAESSIVLATVEAVNSDSNVVAVSNVGKDAKYPARVPLENDLPPVGSSVLVNTAVGGQPFVQQTMDVPEGESLGSATDESITVFNQSTKPDESNATAGDVWLDRYAYLPRGLWRFAPSSGTAFDLPFSVDDTNIYAANISNDTLYALDYSNEFFSITWSVSRDVPRNVISDANGVYVVDQNGTTLYSHNKSDGSVNWSTTLSDTPTFVAQDDTHIFVSETTGGDANTLVSVDKTDGSVNWETDVCDTTVVPMLTDSSYVYVADQSNVLSSIDKTDGSLNWSITIGNFGNYAIAQDSNNVYVGTTGGEVRAVAKSDGTEIHNGLTNFTDEIVSLEVDDTYIYIAAVNDGIYKHDKTQDNQVYDATFADTSPDSRSTTYLASDGIFFGDTSLTYKLDLNLNIIWYTLDVYTTDGNPHILENNGEVYIGSDDGMHAIADEKDRSEGESHTFDGTYWFRDQ